MMGWGFRGEVMDGPWNYIPPGNPKSLTITQVRDIVAKALASEGNTDLQLAEVMQFSNHFYAEVEEKSTKIHAYELLISKYTGDIFPEPGPNMMWNQKYGHMAGGMMVLRCRPSDEGEVFSLQSRWRGTSDQTTGHAGGKGWIGSFPA